LHLVADRRGSPRAIHALRPECRKVLEDVGHRDFTSLQKVFHAGVRRHLGRRGVRHQRNEHQYMEKYDDETAL
jgi:hypothetical protein